MVKKALKYFLIFCVVCGVASAITGGGNSTNQQQQPATKTAQPAPAPAPAPKQYAAVDANTMMTELERNAAAANQKYKGKAICVTGRVGVIDSEGNYILVQSDDEFSIIGIMCNLNKKDKAQTDFLLNIQKGQYVRVYGDITDVGEVVGYTLKVEKFES